MQFYFIVHTILGMVAANSSNLQMAAQTRVGAFPLWIHGSWGAIGVSLGIFSALASIVTTFTQWGFSWALITLAELVFGAVLVGFLPMGVRLFLAALGPIICVVIMGSLWGFWYI